ncbi:MAG: hypothetical protein FWE71_17410 [Nocardioidaceae bacterium]|nr:hypothetical protein [Nocardioidaceae bacterium]MCL2611973.1 hypothetical protein [Nocardioidaceae bacterium]
MSAHTVDLTAAIVLALALAACFPLWAATRRQDRWQVEPDVVVTSDEALQPEDMQAIGLLLTQGFDPVDEVTRVEWRYLDGATS